MPFVPRHDKLTLKCAFVGKLGNGKNDPTGIRSKEMRLLTNGRCSTLVVKETMFAHFAWSWQPYTCLWSANMLVAPQTSPWFQKPVRGSANLFEVLQTCLRFHKRV